MNCRTVSLALVKLLIASFKFRVVNYCQYLATYQWPSQPIYMYMYHIPSSLLCKLVTCTCLRASLSWCHFSLSMFSCSLVLLSSSATLLFMSSASDNCVSFLSTSYSIIMVENKELSSWSPSLVPNLSDLFQLSFLSCALKKIGAAGDEVTDPLPHSHINH